MNSEAHETPGNALKARFRHAHHLIEAGRAAEAVPLLRDLAGVHPSNGALHLALAVAHQRLGQGEAAIATAETACRLRPDDPAAHHLLGELYLAAGRHDAAGAAFDEALARDPQRPASWNGLGLAHLAADRPDRALAALRRAVALAPNDPVPRLNLADALRQGGHAEAALAFLHAQPEPFSRDPRWWTQLALAAQDLGDFPGALEHLERALALAPDLPQARWNRALLRLRLGDLARGWRDYAWGSRCGVRPPPPPLDARWRGPHDPRPLWVTPEQGVGDEIQFAAGLMDLRQAGVAVHWQSDPRLVPLLRRAHPGLTVAAGPPAEAHRHARLPMGDLPALTRPHLAAFPRHRGYLRPDPARVARFARWLDALGPGLKVGITWRAGIRHLARARRGIPFPLWEPLFRLPGVHWVNLQHGDCETERRRAARAWGRPIHAPPGLDRFADLDGLAALVQALDLVITVDNASAHLTGALGRPGWVLLPAVADWRWFVERDDSPWYPSLRLFRQTHPGDWWPVMKKAAAALAGAARGKVPRATGAG